MGVSGLYTLGATDIFAYLNDVTCFLRSPDSVTSQRSFPSLKSIVGNCLIFSIRDLSSPFERITRATSILLGWRKPLSIRWKNFNSYWPMAAFRESLRKTPQITNHLDLTPFCKLRWKKGRKFLVRFPSSIWLATKEEQTTLTWKNKQELTALKLTNHFCLSRSASEPWIKEKAIHLSGAPN